METITAELKIRKALTSQVPPAAQYQLVVGQRVLIDRENSNIADGPFEIVESRRSNFRLCCVGNSSAEETDRSKDDSTRSNGSEKM
jgi:hypothetical protein